MEHNADDDPETEVPGDSVEILHDESQSHDHIADKESTENMFPKLHRIEPGKVGDQVELELEPGQFYTRITKAVQPPIFVIPSFLSNEECDYIIERAVENGLNTSHLFGADIESEFADSKIDRADISRISEQTWLHKQHLDHDFYTKLQKRVAMLTGIPVYVIQSSEPMQVVSYKPGGHYHAHLDSSDQDYHLPCCIQQHCGNKEETAKWAECCRLCRFITIMYYLNEPEEGGETAFPLADMNDELFNEKFVNLKGQQWTNLSRYCYNASLKISPRRGMAVMWYSHFVDEETGYLGQADARSNHGGCDIIKGTKWIANTWISSTSYKDRFIESVWYRNNEE
ncbi:hypothetical protein ACF0H5_017412 [Mactra antiquata]